MTDGYETGLIGIHLMYQVVYRSHEQLFASLRAAYEYCVDKVGAKGQLMTYKDVEESMRDRVGPLSLLVIGRDADDYGVVIKRVVEKK